MVQWLRLPAPNAGGSGSIPGQKLDPSGTAKSSHATTKDLAQPNKLKKKKKNQLCEVKDFNAFLCIKRYKSLGLLI